MKRFISIIAAAAIVMSMSLSYSAAGEQISPAVVYQPDTSQTESLKDSPMEVLLSESASDLSDPYKYELMAARDYMEQQKSDREEQALAGYYQDNYASDQQTLSGGETIASGGRYYITPETKGIINIITPEDVILEGLGMYAESNDPGQIKAASGLSIECTSDSTTNLIIRNVAITSPAQDHNVINFKMPSSTLLLDGVNLLEANDTGKAVVHYILNKGDSYDSYYLTVRSYDINNPGTLYLYKRGAGAGFGSDGSETRPSGAMAFGANENDGSIYDNMKIFGKTSKMGALFGNGSYCKIIPDVMKFLSGTYNLESNARGSIIGGSAGEGAAGAGIVALMGGQYNMNVDYSGAAIGGGGEQGSNDRTGGITIFSGCSVRTFVNHNASSQWSAFGVADEGVNDACITTLRRVAYDLYDTPSIGDTEINLDELAVPGAPAYLLKFDTSMVTTKSGMFNGQEYDYVINFKTDNADPNDRFDTADGYGHAVLANDYEYYYINESLYKQEQIQVGTTYRNWDSVDNLPENKRDTNLYMYMPGYDLTLTVNDQEEFKYEFIPQYDTDGNITDGTFKLIRSSSSVTGGDVITDGGNYVVTSVTPGAVKIDTEEQVRLMTAERTEGISITAESGRKIDLVLDQVEMSCGSGTLIAADSGKITLDGHSVLSETSAVQGMPALSISGDLEIWGESLYDKLDISTSAPNHAIDIAPGGSYTQNGGTVIAIKTGETPDEDGAAVAAGGASFKVNDGAFYGSSNAEGVPVIYADYFGAGSEGTITAQAYANKYAVCADNWGITSGSIKLTGNNAAVHNGSAAYDTGSKGTLAELSAYEACPVDVSNIQATGGSGVYTCWIDDNTKVSCRNYYGTGHKYTSESEGTTFVEYADSDTLHSNDPCLYFWFPVNGGTHKIYVNDDSMGETYWTDDGWAIDRPTYTITIKTSNFYKNEYPDGGTLTVCSTSGINSGDTITGTYTVNPGYALKDIRYYYQLGYLTKTYTLTAVPDKDNPNSGTFSFKMPGGYLELEASWVPVGGTVMTCGGISLDEQGKVVTVGGFEITRTTEGSLLVPVNIRIMASAYDDAGKMTGVTIMDRTLEAGVEILTEGAFTISTEGVSDHVKLFMLDKGESQPLGQAVEQK